MMSRLFIACAICLLACHFSSAVILRPKWYPYFRRENQGTGEGGSSNGQSALPVETMTARQARAPEMERASICPDGQFTEECLSKITMLIGRIIQLNSQSPLLY